MKCAPARDAVISMFGALFKINFELITDNERILAVIDSALNSANDVADVK